MIRRLLLLALAASVACPAQAQWRRDDKPIEPVDIPPSIQQGVDMIYVDPEIAPRVRERAGLMGELGIKYEPGAPIDLFQPVSLFYTSLRRGLQRYRSEWGGLPQVEVEAGPVLKPGAAGGRVAALRERLGLAPGDKYDAALARAVKRYQQVHGIKADGVAGAATVESLNRGAAHYERVLMVNLDRARTLPGSDEKGRYVLVDAGAARIFLVEDGKVTDSMKAIVGKAASPTPVMAAVMRYASVNPYWNVPVDLAKTLVAPKVLSEGLGHIASERYQLLSDWTADAEEVDPASVDWRAVADGSVELRVRQLPGANNSMGRIKFMMPNDYGIYLHDTNDKSLFGRAERWISNGCVRVEDAGRLATWLFGEMPAGKDPKVEEDVPLPEPVPVYITYLTAEGTADGVLFRGDPYDRDGALVGRYVAADDAEAAGG
ncbi:L,D-transpeptidase family protein [Sphingomonas lenta]|uniref:Murein L,D-transpeptidase n=1 Tax=Sphingomonas lenta TaxID=1141887 RepID=A0A2A2SB75_9SPHN|nr:L,D-transpeptidase family protein [Sphingomonas lenta]PAX06554.1 murein L,D-transpeptidase [Sphingomonas lenta]